jgi:2-keto-4-pentenoate hydratase
VVWTTFTGRRIAVRRSNSNDLRIHFIGASNSCIEVIDLKPQKNAIPVGLVTRITNRPVVMFDLESMQLKDQDAIRDEPLILCATVRTSAAKQALAPAAACLDIAHRNAWLGTKVGRPLKVGSVLLAGSTAITPAST